MGLRYPVRARRWDELVAMAFPQTVNQPEAFVHYLYDTQTYTDNATTQLTYFTVTNADRSITNLDAGGQLDDPKFFEIYGVNCDIFQALATGFVTTAAGGVVGAIDDIGLLVMQNRPRLTLTISDKRYGPWPLSLCHSTGGPSGFGWGTFTAEESLQFANNGPPDGGLWIGGSIIIPPKVGFSVVLDWPAAVNVTADYRLRITLAGILHRAVR